MKPLSIAEYLGHVGRPAGEEAPSSETPPFRPRNLPRSAAQPVAPVLRPVFERTPKAGVGETNGDQAPRRSPWAPKPSPLPASAPQSPENQPAQPRDISTELAEAYARGLKEGLALGRAEVSERCAAELAAAREQAETQRQEFHISEYMEFEGAIRSGLRQVEQSVGAAVTRILAPFLSDQVVKRAVEELGASIARLSAGGSPGLIKIRGPARILAPLRERIADLAVEVECIESEGIDAVVESGPTQIVAELRPWAELLASYGV